MEPDQVMRETALEDSVKTMAAQLGIIRLHVVSAIPCRAAPGGVHRLPVTPGWPDETLVGHGAIMFRELKSATGRATREQMAILDRLRMAGEDAGIWRPADLYDGTIAAELARLARLRGTLGRITELDPHY